MNQHAEQVAKLKSVIRNEAALRETFDIVDREFCAICETLPPLQNKRLELQAKLREVDEAKAELAELLSQTE